MEIVSKKKKKAGRPAKTVKREIRAAVRFSKSEYFIIREKAAKAGINASAYIRQVALHATIKNRLADEERQFVRQLIGMANNVNQIAKACHQEGVLRAMAYFETYRNHLDKILEKLKACSVKYSMVIHFIMPAGMYARMNREHWCWQPKVFGVMITG